MTSPALEFDLRSSIRNIPDYPKLGVWPDAYYITFNLFNSTGFAGGMARNSRWTRYSPSGRP